MQTRESVTCSAQNGSTRLAPWQRAAATCGVPCEMQTQKRARTAKQPSPPRRVPRSENAANRGVPEPAAPAHAANTARAAHASCVRGGMLARVWARVSLQEVQAKVSGAASSFELEPDPEPSNERPSYFRGSEQGEQG